MNFLVVIFNLDSNSYQPFNKPNNYPTYINVQSKHHPNIIISLPTSIEKRINSISSSKEIFEKAAGYYNNALNYSGYSQKISYSETTTTPSTSNRQRLFNPPYSTNVKSNIVEHFSNLINNHFPRRHKFHKISNRNNVKVSYSCLSNDKNITTSHNKKTISPPADDIAKKCNCRN